MKVKTASTRKVIDRLKSRARAQVGISRDWTLYLAARLLTSSRRENAALLPLLVFASSFSFATLELVMLILLGFFAAKLQCYRLVNLMLGAFESPH